MIYKGPKFSITPVMVTSLTRISEILGQLNAQNIIDVDPKLRKKNMVKSIASTCAIENNTLTIEGVTDIIDGKRVLGEPHEILEIKNTLNLYRNKHTFDFRKVSELLRAHQLLMRDLINDSGQFRINGVAITNGEDIVYTAPQSYLVSTLVDGLFAWVNEKNTYDLLLRSCVFHYELEHIHPFSDGNGRLGRFWQSLMLIEYHPIFRFTPIESIVHAHQHTYYQAFLTSQKRNGNCNAFIEFSLFTIADALTSLLKALDHRKNDPEDRIRSFLNAFKGESFSRKTYMHFFKAISALTASRDLALGIRLRLFEKKGLRSKTTYFIKKSQLTPDKKQ